MLFSLARHYRMLFSHTFVCTIFSDATFALCLRTLCSHARPVHLLRNICSQTIVEHYSRTCLAHAMFARHFRISCSQATFARYVRMPVRILLSVRYFPRLVAHATFCTPCRTAFSHATPFSQTLSPSSSSNLRPILIMRAAALAEGLYN